MISSLYVSVFFRNGGAKTPPDGCFLFFSVFLSGFGLGLDSFDVGALVAFLHGVGHGGGNQADGADGVIVCGDDVVDLVRVAVGVDNGDNRDVQGACSCP